MLVPVIAYLEVRTLAVITGSAERAVYTVIFKPCRASHFGCQNDPCAIGGKMPGDRHQPFIISVSTVDKVADFDCAFAVLNLFTAQLFTLVNEGTSLAHLVIRHKCQFTAFVAFCNGACGAASDCVGVVVGYCSMPGLKRKIPLESRCRASSPSRIASSCGVSGNFDLRT